MPILTIHKHADKSGERLPDGSWPLDGISLPNAPETTEIPTKTVAAGRAEGWISVEGESVVVRPAGPADDPWRGDQLGRNHVFHHLQRITFHTRDGDVSYTVTHQPDKYVADGDDSTKMTDKHYAAANTRVDNFYGVTREG